MTYELRNILLFGLTAAWSLGLAALGAHEAVLYLAPALLLALPLAFGRFPGEDVLAAARALDDRRRRPAPVLSPVCWALEPSAPRGGRLIATAVGLRGPPAITFA